MRDNERTRRIFSHTIGYICIFAFFSITTYIIFIFYFKIGPTILEKQAYGKFLFHFIFGNWLAINIYFNYTMAWLTSPGISKNYQNLAVQYPVCKKCSYNKPPRTHHCSWCSLCILRFDHHCPWLNNCIGFYNHRYFYQCCCFMATGCLYAGSFGYREYQISLFEVQIFRHGDSFFMTADIFNTMGVYGFITYYIFIMVFLLGFILLGFSGWHGRIISRGETLFEYVLQEDYVRRYYEYGFIFVKIHDINLVENWKEFFGVDSMREFVRRILLPSTHKPKGNGIIMDDYHIHTNLCSHKKDFDQSKQGTSNVSSGYHIIPGGYLVKKYPFESLSCPRQPITNSFSSWYQSRTSMNDRKNNVDMNEV